MATKKTTKTAKLNKDIKELRKIFENEENPGLALMLLDKAEFLEATLSDLKRKVEETGVVTEMCQGSYSIDRENPALRSYNTTIKNYTSIIKQLNDMLPKKNILKDDDFDNFGDDVK